MLLPKDLRTLFPKAHELGCLKSAKKGAAVARRRVTMLLTRWSFCSDVYKHMDYPCTNMQCSVFEHKADTELPQIPVSVQTYQNQKEGVWKNLFH